MSQLVLPSESFNYADKFNIYRPIHYLGSKLRFVDSIVEVLNKVDPSSGPVCDLFAGSGTVSFSLAKKRDVVAVDIQEYSRVLCSALLNPATRDKMLIETFMNNVSSSSHSSKLSESIEPLVKHEVACIKKASNGDLEPLCELLENGALITFENGLCKSKDSDLMQALGESLYRLQKNGLLDESKSLLTRYFGGLYFSYLQASHLDMLCESIDMLHDDNKDSFLASILSTASDIVNTIGKQFAQPIKPRNSDGTPKKNIVRLVERDRFTDVIKCFAFWLERYLDIPHPKRQHDVICMDYTIALQKLKGNVSVIYADPPYTRDHYSRYYHVLETICLRDNPEISTVNIGGEELVSRGLYRAERHQSPFCIKTQAPKAFEDLFAGASKLGVPLVLSYSPFETDNGSRPRLMTIDQITELAKEFYRNVSLIKAGGIAHSKLGNSKVKGNIVDAEILFVCET